MGFWKNAQARSQQLKLIAEMPKAGVVAAPRVLAASELVRWAREWAPDAAVTGDGRLVFGRCLELVGPLELTDSVRRREGVPEGAVAVYLVRENDELDDDDDIPDADDFAEGLAQRLSGWARKAYSTQWRRGDRAAPYAYVFGPQRLTADAVAQVLTSRLPDLARANPEDGELFRLTSDDVEVYADRMDDGYTAYPNVIVQPWFTSRRDTTVYVIEGETAADVMSVHAAAEVIRDATGGVLLDSVGFPVY